MCVLCAGLFIWSLLPVPLCGCPHPAALPWVLETGSWAAAQGRKKAQIGAMVEENSMGRAWPLSNRCDGAQWPRER